MPFSFKYCILALAVLASDIAKAQLCDGDTDTLSHNEELSMRATHTPDDPDTYWGFEFLDNSGPYAGITAYGWCVDVDRIMRGGSQYMVDTYSSYDLSSIPAGAVDKPGNLTLVNWLINNHPINSSISIPNCYTGPLTWREYQEAVWTLVDDRVTDQNAIDCVVDFLVTEAVNNGNGFEVSCDDQKIGVLLIVDNNSGSITNQVVMAEIYISEISEICDCAHITGDPHIRTWSGMKYDFHGVCDLVLLQNPDFENGIGMDIHIRTKKLNQFSYVSSAVIRIGNDKLEVMGDLNENLYWVNGQAQGNLDRGMSGYPVSYQMINSHQHEFVVHLGDKKSIVLKTWKKFVRVDIKGATEENFGASLGLLGSFGSGKMIARDSSTVMEDANVFGAEWQVLPSEEMVFHNVEGPQAPEKCDIPMKTVLRRRLAESNISEQQAKIACADVGTEDFDMCVFDVMATGDEDVVGAY